MSRKMKVNINSLYCLDIKLLSKERFFDQDHSVIAKIDLSKSVQFSIIKKPDKDYVIFSYKIENRPIEYRVYIEKRKSNLGRGHYYYFICPETEARCRKLYLDTHFKTFMSRKAFEGIYYPDQKLSKIGRLFKIYYSTDDSLDKLYDVKRFMTHYNGEPTRRYLKLLKINEKFDRAYDLFTGSRFRKLYK